MSGDKILSAETELSRLYNAGASDQLVRHLEHQLDRLYNGLEDGTSIEDIEEAFQGRNFMSCSYRQELGQQVIRWLLIGCTRVNNQSEARTAS